MDSKYMNVAPAQMEQFARQSVISNPTITEKTEKLLDTLKDCISISETMIEKLTGANQSEVAKCGYASNIDGNLSYMRDKLEDLRNNLTIINDRL